MKAEASFILNKAAINKIDGTEARHYSELAEEAARNAEADAERAEEVAREMESLDGRLDTLEETVGDSSAGLVKDVDDLTDIAADMMNDIAGLEAVKNDPVYNANDKKLQLYDILNGDIPYTIDNTKYVDVTPSSSDSQAQIAYKFNSGYASYTSNYRFNISLNSSAYNNGSKYFIAVLSGAQTGVKSTTQDFIVIEYRSSGEDFKLYSGNDDRVILVASPVSPTGPTVNSFSLTSSSIVDSFFKVTKISASISCGNDYFRGMTGFYSIDWSTSPETLTSITAAMATSDYTAADALEALDFSAAVPEKDLAQLYVADTIYKPVDTQAREDISQLDSDLDTLGETVVTHGENIQTLFDTTDDIQDTLNAMHRRPRSWADLQAMVRADAAKQVVEVRDQFECGYGTNDTLLWDVLDINHDTPTDTTKTKSLTLQTHFALDVSREISRREAFYAFTEAATAGKFYFTMGAQPWYADDVNKIFEFEIVNTTNIPVGAQFIMSQSYDATGDGATVKLYLAPEDLTEVEVVIMNIVVEPSAGAVNLGTINRTKQSNLNCIDRALLGNNNWKESLLRQWLNTDSTAGTWWTAQNIWDRPASWVTTVPGFMSYLDADFKATIGRTHVVTVRNTICDGGGTDETDDYFFLISREEAYNGQELSRTSEGTPYAFYKDYAASSSPSTNADPNRVKTKKGSSGSQYWWYRTPYYGNAVSVRRAHTSGSLDSDYSSYGRGVSPACNII